MRPPRSDAAAAFLDGHYDKVLVGKRAPFWKCKHCSTFDNWASRIVCRMCEAKAPAEVAKKAWEESKKPPAARGARSEERGARPPRSGPRHPKSEASEAKAAADQQGATDPVKKLQATLDALKASPPELGDAAAAETHASMVKHYEQKIADEKQRESKDKPANLQQLEAALRRLGAEDTAIAKKLAGIEEARNKLQEEANQLGIQRAELQPKIDEAKKRVQDCIKGRIDPNMCVVPQVALPSWAQNDPGMQAALASLQSLANSFQEAHRTFTQQVAAAEARKQEAEATAATQPASSNGGHTEATEEEEMDLDLGLELSHAGFADMAGQMQLPQNILQQIQEHCAQQTGAAEEAKGQDEDGTWETATSRRNIKLRKQDGLLKKAKGAADSKAITPKEADKAAKLAAAGVNVIGAGAGLHPRG